LYGSLAPRALHSFPTRRSSDLGSTRSCCQPRRTRASSTWPSSSASPISAAWPAPIAASSVKRPQRRCNAAAGGLRIDVNEVAQRSEEHTSELQSRENLVCRLLL